MKTPAQTELAQSLVWTASEEGTEASRPDGWRIRFGKGEYPPFFVEAEVLASPPGVDCEALSEQEVEVILLPALRACVRACARAKAKRAKGEDKYALLDAPSPSYTSGANSKA